MINKNLVAALLVLSGTTAFAHNINEAQIVEPERVLFNPHFTLGVQGGAAYSLGEAEFGDLITPAAQLSLGYQFSPIFGVRVGASGWEAKGGYVVPSFVYKYNYVQANADLTIDLGNLFCGYSPSRVVNPYLFVGAGGNVAFNNDDAYAFSQTHVMREAWDGTKVRLAGRAGLGLNFRLSDHVAVGLEVNANMLNDAPNSKKGSKMDWQYNALAGFKFTLGDSKKVIPAVYAEVAPEPEPVVEQVVVVETPEPQPEPVVVEKTTREDVFFVINSCNIDNAGDAKVKVLADFLKENPSAKISLCGYADNKTGTKEFNKELSKKRAESVAKALIDLGINSERISVDYKGDTLQPFTDDYQKNRVTICIAK